ncbi:MAG: tetratricopeptide repeat protein [Bacteroidales bacterium]|nr:MAG: tetratricopeptide repeat protein [Bacteroidales bacterium]
MKSVLIVILFSFFMPCLFGFHPDSLVKTGNNLYAKGDFYHAIDVYEQIVDSGYEASELYFNLGNAYYKVNNIARAILNYERAKKLNPRDEDIKHNLTIANAHVVDKIDIIPEFFLKTWITGFTNITSSDTWAIISILSFILFLLLFLIYLFSGRIGIKKLSFWLGVLMFLISISSFYSSFKRKRFLTLMDSAIIITPTVTAKSSPAETGVDLFVIHEGSRVKVVDSIDVWNEIKLSDGKRGWVRKTDLTKI